MLLITGGIFQGKLDYALSIEKVSEEDIVDFSKEETNKEGAFTGKILYNFHFLIEKLIDENIDPLKFTEDLVKKNSSAIIIINEIGSGLVPMTKEERYYRELVGRISCFIAEKSEEVHRVICGIGMRIDNARN